MKYMTIRLELVFPSSGDWLIYSGDWLISSKGMCIDIHRITMDDTPFYYMKLVRKGRYKGMQQPKRK